MSTQISIEEFLAEAKRSCRPIQFERLLEVLEFLEERTSLKISTTKAKTHRTLTASYERKDGRRCKVFSCYEDGQVMCQHIVELPEDLNHADAECIREAYRNYRDATGGEEGTSWHWFSISAVSIPDLTAAIARLTSTLELKFK